MDTTIIGKVGITPQGVWSASRVDYNRLDTVVYNSSLYMVIFKGGNVPVGTLPTNATYFEKVLDSQPALDAAAIAIAAAERSDSVIKDGVNLIDKSLLVSGSSWTVGLGSISANAAYKRYPLLELKKNQQYTISGAYSEFLGGLYNSAGVRQSKLNEFALGVFLTKKTFTTGENDNYIGLNPSSYETVTVNKADNTIMLSEGTNEIYFPYKKYVVPGSAIEGAIDGAASTEQLSAVGSLANSNSESLGILVDIKYKFDGTASKSLGSDYTLNAVGDYVEFDASLTGVAPNNGLGIIGTAKGASFQNVAGFYSSTQFAMRQNSGSYLLWTVPSGSFAEYKKYKIEVTATGWQLSVNGTPVSIIAKTDSLILNSIGNAYSAGVFIGNLGNVKIHTSSKDLTISDLKTGGLNVQQVISKKPDDSSKTSLFPVYTSYSPTGSETGHGLFTVFTKYSNNSPYYAAHQIAHIVDTGIRADVWRIYKADLYKNQDGVMISQGRVLLTTGESEFVFQETGKTDATGGYHGDEILTTVVFYLDGVKFTDLTTAFSLKTGSSFHYEQVSNIYETDNATNNVRCFHKKITIFKEGGYKTTNSAEWKSIPAALNPWYSGVSCIALAQSGTYNTENLNYYTAGAAGPKVNEIGVHTVRFQNNTNKLSCIAESRITKIKASGVDKTQEFDEGALTVVYDDNSTRTKYYREVLGKIPAINDIWESYCEVKYLSNNY